MRYVTKFTTYLEIDHHWAASVCFDLECPLCACKPAQLEVGITMDYLLHPTYVK